MSNFYIENNKQIVSLLEGVGFTCVRVYLNSIIYTYIEIDMNRETYNFFTYTPFASQYQHKYISIPNLVAILRDIKIDKILEDV